MHLDFDQPAAFAIFAAAAFHIETEPARVVTAHPRRRQLAEQIADRREGAGVGDRIGARRPADGALVDHDRLVELFETAHRPIRSRLVFRIVKMPEKRAPQNIIDQSRFPAAGNAGHTGETAERKRDVDILQIVFRRADHRQPAVSSDWPTLRGQSRLDALLSGIAMRARPER